MLFLGMVVVPLYCLPHAHHSDQSGLLLNLILRFVGPINYGRSRLRRRWLAKADLGPVLGEPNISLFGHDCFKLLTLCPQNHNSQIYCQPIQHQSLTQQGIIQQQLL